MFHGANGLYSSAEELELELELSVSSLNQLLSDDCEDDDDQDELDDAVVPLGLSR